MATIILKHSTVKDKLPSSAQFGEVFVNYNNENPFLATLNNQGQFEKFLSENKTKELFYTKSEADGKFLTEHQDLSDYAQKSDLDDYLTIASASTIYATKEDLEEFTPTVDAYSKEETDALLSGKSDTNHTHDYSQIQNTPDLSNFATKGEIPDTSGFATKQELEDYQMKSGMSAYLLASEAQDTYQPKGTYVVPSDLNNYVTSGYVEETFAKKGDVPTDVYTKSETDNLLAGKASSSHTHTTSEIIDLDVPKIWKGTLSEYTNLTEIDNDTLYVITDESEQFVTSGEVESMISGFTTLSEVQVELEGYSQTGHTHSEYLTQTSADSRYARVVSCTQAEYDTLVQNDQVEQGVLYCITESNSQSSSDSGNSGSGNSGSGNSGYNPVIPDPVIPDPDILDPDPDPTGF